MIRITHPEKPPPPPPPCLPHPDSMPAMSSSGAQDFFAIGRIVRLSHIACTVHQSFQYKQLIQPSFHVTTIWAMNAF